MDVINNFIQQNSTIALGTAGGLLVLAVFILRKVKTLAILLFVIGGLIFFLFFKRGSIDTSYINKMKENTKEKIMKNIK